MASNGTSTVLHIFSGGKDGSTPYGTLHIDRDHYLYGTTIAGGAGCSDFAEGCGTVFRVAPDGTETVLYTFMGVKHHDGSWPLGKLIQDSHGNLFGTTQSGGVVSGVCYPYGCGTVFKLTPRGSEAVLYAFRAGTDGASPSAGVIKDEYGNLYGTTVNGGEKRCRGIDSGGCGTIFSISADGNETVLRRMAMRLGSTPEAGLVRDKNGNLYGTGLYGDDRGCEFGCGVVFQFTPKALPQ